ncbi:MAG: M56 family metallopeptidase [Gemmatimonadota bacterium]
MLIWMLSIVLTTALVGLSAFLLDQVAGAVGLPRRWIWFGAYLVSALVILIPSPTHLPGLFGSAGSGDPGGNGASALGISEVLGGTSAAVGIPLPLNRILLGLWAVLTLWFLGRWVVAWILTGRESRGWYRVELPEGEVLVSEGTGPAVVGLTDARIVVPRWVLRLPSLDRTLVLAHEDQHRRAGDPLLVSVATLLTAALPWNVPLWACLGRLREAVELDCDARVVRTFPQARGVYGSLLVRIASGPTAAGLAFAPFTHRTRDLERRLEMITERFTRRSRLQVGALTTGAILLLVSACLVPGTDEAEEAPTSPTPTDVRADLEAAEEALERSVLAEEPAFTPFEVRPELLNMTEVRAALEANYPATLRDAGIGGVVVLQMFIDENGELQNAVVFESSGHDALDEGALAVARTMEFSPAQNRQEPVPVWIQQAVTFQTR